MFWSWCTESKKRERDRGRETETERDTHTDRDRERPTPWVPDSFPGKESDMSAPKEKTESLGALKKKNDSNVRGFHHIRTKKIIELVVAAVRMRECSRPTRQVVLSVRVKSLRKTKQNKKIRCNLFTIILYC